MELVEMILEHLPPESVTALGLTCRDLYAKIFSNPSTLPIHAKARFLQLLEKEHPTLFFCHDCVQLHTWRLRHKLQTYGFYNGPCYTNFHREEIPVQCRSRPGSMPKVISQFRPDLNFFWARLVMNRQLYGPAHGPPLTPKKETRIWRWDKVKITEQSTWTFQIINNNLFAQAVTTLRADDSGPGDPHRALKDIMHHWHDDLICRHHSKHHTAFIPEVHKWIEEDYVIPSKSKHDFLRPLTRIYYDPATGFFTGTRQHQDARELIPTSGTIRSCTVCFTDFRIRITSEPTTTSLLKNLLSFFQTPDPIKKIPKTWTIEIARWHGMGKCRSPYDLEWENLVRRPSNSQYLGRHNGEPGVTEYTRREDAFCEPGEVYKTWMEKSTGEPVRVGDDVEYNSFTRRIVQAYSVSGI
jgi:hypothetical protein